MRARLLVLFAVLTLGLGVIALRPGKNRFPPAAKPAAAAVADTPAARKTADVIPSSRAPSPSSSSISPAPATAPTPAAATTRAGFATDWAAPQPEAFAAFRDWTARFRAAAPAQRAALAADGVALARTRRPALLDLIQTDPERALALTIPAEVRRELPASVVAELETRVSGMGDLTWLASIPAPGAPAAGPATWREARIGDVTFRPHAYGRRAALPTKLGLSLHGIALDGELALLDSPVRLLEPGETAPAAGESNPECPVSGAEPDASAPAVTVAALGRTFEFCGAPGMAGEFERRLLAAENAPGPHVAALTFGAPAAGTPTKAAAPATAWTLGPKRVLVVQVDFSDLPGQPVATGEMYTAMDVVVPLFFDRTSYGRTSLITTVAPKVYRLPRTASSYALAGISVTLHNDAMAAAGADYKTADFDRLMVVHGGLSPSQIAGSKLDYAGLAEITGPRVWINGSFGFSPGSVAHELCHTYGLRHSNLWQVTDGNPISATGHSVEYGDPFDPMGGSYGLEKLSDLNAHSKSLLSWLPDGAITDAIASGTYRIYRHDVRTVTPNLPQALRVFRDGQRTYWISFRQDYFLNDALLNGVSVHWTFPGQLSAVLLDCNTPGTSSADSALLVGRTLDDPDFGVKIRPVRRGGSEPNQWIEVEVTRAATTGVVAQLGQNFYDNVTKSYSMVPAGLSNVVAVAGGANHALALQADGTVVAWGDNSHGQCSIPFGLNSVVSISACRSASGAVQGSGRVVLWGELSPAQAKLPPDLFGVRQIALGADHVLALKRDGTITGWGGNQYGQATPPPGLNSILQVAAGNNFSVALRADGVVVRWGVTLGGVPFPVGFTLGTAIAAGANHALVLQQDGTVVAWGGNASRQAEVPSGLTDVIAIAAGDDHSVALRKDGTVVAWGSSGVGQAEVPPALPRCTAIGASALDTFVVVDNRAVITTSPQSRAVVAGGSTTLSVATSATTGVTFQWRKTGVTIPGATSASLTLSNISAAAAGAYDVVVTEGNYRVTSAPAFVSLATPLALAPLPPTLPAVAGFAFSIGVGVTGGAGPLSYQWRKNGLPVAGATSAALTFAKFAAGDVGSYDVIVSDAGLGTTTTSSTTVISLARPLVIVTQPQSQTLESGTSAVLSVAVADGFGQLRYQWFLDGVLQPVATSTFSLGTLPPGFAGRVTVTVSDATGSVTSEVASISVVAVTRLINLSILSEVTADDALLTLGFVVGGRGTVGAKPVLLRAAGPSLTAFGVAGALPDPQLALLSGPATIAANDNWGGSGPLTLLFGQVGAFPYDLVTSRDAALSAPGLAAGNYSVQVRGVAGATGKVMAEIYDTSVPGGVTVATPRLINVSVFKNIGSGLAAGFVIAGGGTKTVLIRAIGPSLTAFGLPAAALLADPKIDLIDATSKVIATNDNWGGTAALTAAFTQVGAFQLANTASKDAALLATLPPGNYSVSVSGLGGTSGIALVEVYDVP